MNCFETLITVIFELLCHMYFLLLMQNLILLFYMHVDLIYVLPLPSLTLSKSTQSVIIVKLVFFTTTRTEMIKILQF